MKVVKVESDVSAECSFCGANETEVAILFSNGEDKTICSNCVQESKKLIEDS